MPALTSLDTSAIVRSEVCQTAMKTCLVLFALGLAIVMPTNAQTATSESGREPVVVELFTSEGCSDCPPADALLKKMEQQPLAGVDIIPLEEHVDYWNQDGWIDPFSSMAWTARQRTYVAMVKNGTPYSPEMVVDGQSQFVGSNGRAAQAAIESAARDPKTDVTISVGKLEGSDSQDFNVSVGRLVGNTAAADVAEVWIALTEDGLQSSVTRGENAGHVLYHAAVLRSLRKIGVASPSGASTSFSDNPSVKFNSHWNRAEMRVVIFVQEKKSHKILGAASLKVVPESSG